MGCNRGGLAGKQAYTITSVVIRRAFVLVNDFWCSCDLASGVLGWSVPGVFGWCLSRGIGVTRQGFG